MNKILKYSLAVGLIISTSLSYGGEDRKRGSAGATELLMNPWTKSAGYAGAYTSGIRGVEAMRFNVAGIADTSGMSLGYSYTSYLAGADVSSGAFGFTQAVGKTGTIGLTLNFFQLGDFYETTVNQPDGTGIVFTPTYFNLGLAYSKRFSESIKGGILVRMVSQSIRNVSTTGVVVDAGIQYQPKDLDKFRFGVSLRNVGSSMQFLGDGLLSRGSVNRGNQYNQSLQQRSSKFEVPTVLYIGAAYDVYRTEDRKHILTAMGTFNSNSYTKDRYLLGAEYTFNNLLVLRAGFDYYSKMYNVNLFDNTDANGGPTAGITLKKSYGEGDISKNYEISYSYRHTNVLGGNHSVGVSFDF